MKSVRFVLAVLGLTALPLFGASAQGRVNGCSGATAGKSGQVPPGQAKKCAPAAAAASDDCKSTVGNSDHVPPGQAKKCPDVPPPPTNQPPSAGFTYNCDALSCSFTSTSSDPDGTVASYSWTFGDGGAATLQNPSYTYGAGGSYTVTLTVTDDQGAESAPSSQSVTVTAPPPPPPPIGVNFASGTVFADVDGDGRYDPVGAGDTPIEGVTVQLLWLGSVVQSATTLPDGTYRFDGLGNTGSNSWELCVGVPAGFTQGPPSGGSYNGCNGTGYSFQFNLPFQSMFPGDFSMLPPQ